MRRAAPEARRWPPLFFPLAFVLFTLCNLCPLSSGAEVITPDKPMRDPDTLVSAGGSFTVGFFSPGGGRLYLGMWYGNIPEQTVVWVANRENPINGSGSVVELARDGRLVLYDGDHRMIWSSNSSSASSPGANGLVARLLDAGNLVVREGESGDEGNILWQSFDYPTDTLLAGMKLGRDLRTGLDRYLVSSKAPDDPSPGDYSFRMELQGSPQLVLMDGSRKLHRIGPWNGARLSGVPETNTSEYFTFEFVSNESDVYYTYRLRSSAIMSRLVLNSSGVVERFVWLNQRWSRYWWSPANPCDRYGECGAYGVCDPRECSCTRGFKPRSELDWGLRDWSGGCEREAPLDCRGGGDQFVAMNRMKLPDAAQSVTDRRMNMEECRVACRSNCLCMAFASADVKGGRGCIMWMGNLTDLRQFPEGGQDLYVRVAASVLGDRRGGANDGGDRGKGKKVAVIVSVAVSAVLGFLLLGFVGRCVWKKKAKTSRVDGVEDISIKSTTRRDDLELPLFGFGDIAAATDNFSDENKIGEGGFGPVYKGELEDGQGIAVKRLSKRSGQGIHEFMNEVSCIAKLQHRNLVRLLGCCTDGEERILVYEYMHNKSLASIIFDKERSALLNWKQRFNIILGVARGLLYLHQDSRLRIVHRDLKASNILLDGEMNPKISDFGTARIFSGGEEDAAKTSKVVGTYGYMSPEYAMDGVFSVKTDVFSFGVLIIEIMSGKRNKGFYYDDSYLNLILLAWRLWNEGSCWELLDETMGDPYSPEEVMRCIQVGLLCVQERADDRPTMSLVVQMLGGTSAALPPPRQPGFCMERRSPIHSGSPTTGVDEESRTVNHVTVTMPQGR